MSYIVVIRECKHTDAPAANEVIRNAYLSNVTNSWCNALFKEITFQSIIMLAAFMFIFIGVPFFYCVTAIPLVLLLIYVVIYANFALKAMEVISTKRPLQSWVAEVYQPYFFTRNPQNFSYKIIPEHRLEKECIDTANYQRKIIGTVSVMNHFVSNNSAWLFRLAVDKSYRNKGIGKALVQTVQAFARQKGYVDVHLVVSECQDSARQLFSSCGFQMRLMYHKMLVGSALTLLMYHLDCDLRPDL